jgi:CBS-domain-containing membrane protein
VQAQDGVGLREGLPLACFAALSLITLHRLLSQLKRCVVAVQFLSTVPVTNFRAPKDVVRVAANTTYMDALRTLSEHRVSCAPVYAEVVRCICGSVHLLLQGSVVRPAVGHCRGVLQRIT